VAQRLLCTGAVKSLGTGLVLATLLVAGPAAAQDVASDVAGEEEILGRMNAMRNVAGLPALARDVRLDAAARMHSADMAFHAMLAHVSPRTGDPSARVHAAGVDADTLAENIAQAADALDAHRRLVASEAHRENMMSPRFTHVGISVVPGETGVYVTEVFARLAEPAGEEPQVAEAPQVPGPPPLAPPSDAVAPWNDGEAVDADAPPAPAPGGAIVEGELPADAPTLRAPAPGERRVTGYWVFAQGRWWYYPLPPGAQPGQVLTPDPNVTGPPPPGTDYRQPRYHVYPYAQPAPRYDVRPRIYSGPAPSLGWSPRRHYWRWRHSH